MASKPSDVHQPASSDQRCPQRESRGARHRASVCTEHRIFPCNGLGCKRPRSHVAVVYSDFRKHSQHFSLRTFDCVLDFIVNRCNWHFCPFIYTQQPIMAKWKPFFLCLQTHGQSRISHYMSIHTLRCSTLNCGQVCLTYPSDVSRTWLEYIRGKLNWLDIVYKGTHLCISGS